MNQKNLINLRNTYAFGMILLMLLVSELTHEKEILFPEIGALVIGAWSMERQPWNVSRIKMIVLLTLSAFFGILIVRYSGFSVYIQVLSAFSFTAAALIISRTSMVPMISACILPILLGTTSIIYPISVSLMTIMIALFQKRIETENKKQHRAYNREPFLPKEECLAWLLRFILLALISYAPIANHAYYFIAPPVIVTFVEFTFLDSKARKHPIKIFLLICTASILGFIAKGILNDMCHLPVTVCGCLAFLCLLCSFQKLKIYFPPAGAIALLPLLLKSSGLYLYPIEVSIGTALFITCALLFFRPIRENITLVEEQN